MSSLLSATLRCPTCRASQEWSPTCRRCRCDLTLLQTAAADYRASRQQCLQALSAADGATAWRLAQHCRQLDPAPESHRLLALASLVKRDFAAARRWAETWSQATNAQGEA